jgi:hypothetical protein
MLLSRRARGIGLEIERMIRCRSERLTRVALLGSALRLNSVRGDGLKTAFSSVVLSFGETPFATCLSFGFLDLLAENDST